MNDVYYIYAFKNKKGKIVYVGKTINPKIRETFHRGATSSKIRKDIKGFKFKILRKTNIENVYRLESQIIKSLKKKSQCYLNKNTGNPSRKKPVVA